MSCQSKSIFHSLKKITFSFIFFCSISNIAYSDCNIFKGHNIKNLSFIDVEIADKKKWYKNLGNLLLQKIGKREWNTKKNKKKYKATIKFYFKNNTNCSEAAKIRFHGDGRDHINIINGFPSSSMNIKLTNGNFNNIVNFLLLLPSTRNDENEIFNISLIKKLNILAPETFYTKVKFRNGLAKFIFQEKIRKEFLESNGLNEGPIFGGHENFYRYNDFERVARLMNTNWIKNSDNKLQFSFDTLDFVNILYLKDPKLNHGKKLKDYQSLNLDFSLLNQFEKRRFYEFETLMYVLTSYHALRGDNRRIYYHPIKNEIYPIYYDGMSTLLEKNPLEFYDDIKKNHLRSEYDQTHKPIPTQASIMGVKYLKYKLQKLNVNDFKKDLEERGLVLSEEKIIKLLKNLNMRLERLSKVRLKELDLKLNPSPFKIYSENNTDVLVFRDRVNSKLFYFCDFQITNCDKKILKRKDVIKLLKQNYKHKQNPAEFQFINQNLEAYKKGNLSRKKIGLMNYKVTKIDKNFNIFHNEFVDLKYNLLNKKIKITQKNISGRAIIYNSTLKDWTFDFIGFDKNILSEPNLRISDNLTGCVTFLDSKLDNLIFNGNISSCEDMVNFINSSGVVKKLSLSNTLFDSMDADFSNLKFLNVKISQSKNDCLDFSYGIYSIKNTNLEYCDDKAISIGEKSNVKISNVKIKKSNIGVAVKDHSIAIVENLKVFESKKCISAYRKKQEFGPSKIKIKNFICEKSDIVVDQDKESLISIN